QYDLSRQEPDIQIYEVDLRGNRSITLRHRQHERMPLHEDDALEVMKHVRALWRFDVRLESIWDGAVTDAFLCDADSSRRVSGKAAS
ncbi:MAG: SpoVR family protein, partial [Gammaproteobacteria bacterium]|nr:SpoVR family protein [Gammaproteobacteria bacterium]